jgi:mRNA interferase MazF
MYKQREIVLVPFPYSDFTISKLRPALILFNNNVNSKFHDTLACVVTSNLFKDNYSVDLESTDLNSCVLPEKPIIKYHKLFTIQQSLIIKRFSIISKEKFEVESALYKLI